MKTGKSIDSPNNNTAIQDGSSTNELNCGQESIAEPKPMQNLRSLPNMSLVCKHDVVRSIITGKIGFVAEVLGDFDSNQSLNHDVDSDSDDNEEDIGHEEDGEDATQISSDKRVDGPTDVYDHKSHHCYQVRIIWIDEFQTIECATDVVVLLRRFLHGSCVASASDPNSQVGIVIGVDVSVDLLNCDGSTVKDVDAKDLKRVGEFNIDDYVVFGPWLGRVADVLANFNIRFDNGFEYEIVKADRVQRESIVQDIREDIHFPFSPGQRVRVTWPSLIKNSYSLEATVSKISVNTILIDWILAADGSSTIPAKDQSPKNLKLLSCFPHENWELGDWCFLSSPILSACTLTDRGNSKSELSCDPAKEVGFEAVKAKESKENCAVEIYPENLGTSTMPIWVESVDESALFHCKKNQKVVVSESRKVSKKEEKFERAKLISNTRTRVDVSWQNGNIEQGINSISLIPVESIGDHDFLVDQYVIEVGDINGSSDRRRVGVVKSFNANDKTVNVKWLKLVKKDEDARRIDAEEVVSVYELENHPDYNYCLRDVVIRLPSQTVTADIANTDQACLESLNTSLIGNITGFRNGDIVVTWVDGRISTVGPEAVYVVHSDDEDSVGPEAVSVVHSDDEDSDYKNQSANEDDNESVLLDLDEAICTLKRDTDGVHHDSEVAFINFDMSRDPSDHYFLNSNKEFNKVERRWLKKFQEDCSILENSLPAGIYVRMYEDRIDLLRAVIVGVHGTPYQDGLFFFDVYLPPEYPHIPPSVYYHSGGWKINPNLYKDGKICLSLLNTWTGEENEMWNPSSSTILQVLVSLQGIVLNSKPYFNEAGFDLEIGMEEGEKNSLSYNENTFLVNCRTMMNVIRRPPKDFEDLVVEHFRSRGYYILKACIAYMEGYRVGSLDASVSCGIRANSNTTGFKLVLSKLVTKLYTTLRDIGANCEEFKHHPVIKQLD